MARSSKLKVFRTPIGFHDAYVAAPSQKAALAAWGAESNLFASGGAELVEDAELMREPLADPGKVVRRLRGTAAEHMAALPKRPAGARAPARGSPAQPVEAGQKPAPKAKLRKPKPRPDRATLDRAEAAKAELDERHAAQMADLAREQARLDRTRKALEARQEKEQAKVLARVAAVRDKYERAMQAWRDS